MTLFTLLLHTHIHLHPHHPLITITISMYMYMYICKQASTVLGFHKVIIQKLLVNFIAEDAPYL